MDGGSLVTLCLRLAGLLVVVSTLSNVPYFLTDLTRGGERVDIRTFAIGSVAPLMIQLSLGLALIFSPRQVAEKMLRVPIADPATPVVAATFERAAYAVLGGYFAVTGAGSLLFTAAKLRIYQQAVDNYPTSVPLPPLLPDDFAWLCLGIFQVVVGTLLFIGSGAIARWRGRLNQ